MPIDRIESNCDTLAHHRQQNQPAVDGLTRRKDVRNSPPESRIRLASYRVDPTYVSDLRPANDLARPSKRLFPGHLPEPLTDRIVTCGHQRCVRCAPMAVIQVGFDSA